MPKFVLIAVVFLAVSCRKDEPVWLIENLNNGQILILGHGGMGNKHKYPMDSFESLEEVLEIGADGTEMDVRMTRDSVLVLFHDDQLGGSTSCEGDIRDKTWAEIKDCRYVSTTLSKINIIQAAYFFDRVTNKDRHIFTFDCKVTLEDSPAYLRAFASALLKLIEDHHLDHHSNVESFNVDFLKNVYAGNKHPKLFLYANTFEDVVRAQPLIPLYGTVMDRMKTSKQEIRAFHARKLRVTLFNAGTEEESRAAIEMSPDCIQADKPEYLLKVFGRFKRK